MRYFSKKEEENFLTYQHRGGKTTFEAWQVNNIWCHVEPLIPSFISANSVTLLGHLPLLMITCYFIFIHEDQTYSSLEGAPRWLICLGALAFLWFSAFDNMDGLRARRLKNGSPLGRVIDEGLDPIAYLHAINLLTWTLRLEPTYLVIFMSLVNAVNHTMEIRFVVTKNLVLNVGELGPNEIEYLFSAIIFFGGLYPNDVNVFANTMQDTFRVEHELIRDLNWKQFVAGLLGLVYVIMVFDNLFDAFKKDFWKTTYYILPLIYIISLFYLHSRLEIFQKQTQLLFLFY